MTRLGHRRYDVFSYPGGDMTRHSYYAWLILLFFAPVCAADKPLVVEVPTESSRVPVYLSKIRISDSQLTKEYAEQLDELLRYDLTVGGKAQVVRQKTEWEKLAQGKIDMEKWQQSPFHFAIIPQIKGDHLIAQALFLDAAQAKQTEPLTLSGDISHDRRQIHRLYDTLSRQLFAVDGVATTRILYTVKTTGKELAEVWECDYDGANPRQVTHDYSYAVTPTYIAGKAGSLPSNFLYVSYRHGQPKIFLSSLKTGQSKLLTALKGNQLMPAISRQRDQIAYICDITGSPDLFLQHFDPQAGAYGKPRQIYAARNATQSCPTFSPDGKHIAFVSDKSSVPRIYIMPIPEEGAGVKDLHTKEISKRARNGTAPAWSPDGSKIAFSAQTQGVRQIWIYDLLRDTDWQLTNGPSHKENPTWAPDNFHLAYNTADTNKGELMIIDLSNRTPTKITSGPNEKWYPSWEPR